MIQIFSADGRDQPKVVQEVLADLKSTIDIASMAGLYSLYVKYLKLYYVVQQCYANEPLHCWAPSEMVADSFARACDVFPPLQYIVDDVFQNISLYIFHDILELLCF